MKERAAGLSTDESNLLDSFYTHNVQQQSIYKAHLAADSSRKLFGTWLRVSALLHLGDQIVERIFVVSKVFGRLVFVGRLARVAERLDFLRCRRRNWTRITGGFLWWLGSLFRLIGWFFSTRALIGQSADGFRGEKKRSVSKSSALSLQTVVWVAAWSLQVVGQPKSLFGLSNQKRCLRWSVN